ncbi:MAG: N(6)-L-threonylcarbamoyladenine synthase Kae1 [Desulfurococcales archaeon]|nr:N(6)-L-threonylcarbamoyladenine synthase Kae1 [Desulfurococcales archaeon]
MIVLGIESSAHTFGASVVQDSEPYILSDVRRKYVPEKGGIHPKEASLHHITHGPQAVREALRAAGVSPKDLDGIAVALGPGLGPCLRVGATFARALAAYFRKPLIPVNHAVAHIEIGRLFSGFHDPLVVYLSGGNTIIAAYAEGRYRIFGETLDIALGNFIDTLARELGLAPPYIIEGRHVLELCAEKGSKFIEELPYIVKGQDVSFSGLLTAALRLAASKRVSKEDICLTSVEIAYSSIVEVAERGLAHTGKKEVLLVGGVAASPMLKGKFEAMCRSRGVKLSVVPPKYAVDNGAMIAWTGLLALRHGVTVSPEEAYVNQRWKLDGVDLPWMG